MKIKSNKEEIDLKLPNKIYNRIYNNINNKNYNIAYIEKNIENGKNHLL